jgi:hypothetical protein
LDRSGSLVMDRVRAYICSDPKDGELCLNRAKLTATYRSSAIVHVLIRRRPRPYVCSASCNSLTDQGPTNLPSIEFFPFPLQDPSIHGPVSLVLPALDAASVNMRSERELGVTWVSYAQPITIR